MSNTTLDIQSMVEKPEVYIVARSGSSDDEQLVYVDSRFKQIQDITSLMLCASSMETSSSV